MFANDEENKNLNSESHEELKSEKVKNKKEEPNANHHMHDELEKQEHIHCSDHYHDIHHFHKDGEDDVTDDDFKPRVFYKRKNTRNSTFYIAATGIFLALAVIVSGIDIGWEALEDMIPPINGIKVHVRVLDVLIVMLALGVVGPLLTTFIAVMTPVIHAAIHNEFSSPFEVPMELLSYVFIVWILWLLYYLAFRNSIIHKHPNKKIDRFKRWMPFLPFVLIGALVFTLFYMLTMYLTVVAGLVPDEDATSLDVFTKNGVFVNIMIVVGLNLIRCAVDMALFCVIEPQLKIINHKYS